MIVQVTENHATLPEHWQRLIQIDRDGGIRTHIQDPRVESTNFADAIIVEVSAPGIGSSTVTVPVSTESDLHDVVKVAKISLKKDFADNCCLLINLFKFIFSTFCWYLLFNSLLISTLYQQTYECY